MRRVPTSALLAALSLGLLAGASRAGAEEPKPGAPKPAGAKAKAPPVAATNEQAAAALELFKEEFKAKGLTGEDRTSQRDFAMSKLAKVHHTTVVEKFGEIARGSDPILRTLAVIYLGEQSLYPGLAGPHVLAAMKRAGDDRVLLMSALQSIGKIRYLGARDAIRAALENGDYAVKKTAIVTVGDTGDVRLLGDLVKIIGINVEKVDGSSGTSSSGGQQETSEGYSWEGVEVSVDTGTAGDGDQREAERIGKEQMAANQAAAAAGAGGGGGGGGGGEGGGGGGGPSARSPKELLPGVIAALNRMTGETFKNAGAFKKWYVGHRDDIKRKQESFDAAEKEQRASAKK